MADIAAFRGLRYDLSRGADPAMLLAPPYDVVSEAQRAALEAGAPHNVVRLELPRGDGDAKYENARRLLEAWLSEGVLRTDEAPAIYVYEQQFRYRAPGVEDRAFSRRGFFCRLRLEPFSARVVLPHENTLAAPKEDRRKLMTATRTHLSQVFGLYRDPAGVTASLLASVDVIPPELDATTPDACRHRLWAVTDRGHIAAFTKALQGRQVLIADGHHRYETMLAVRNFQKRAGLAPADGYAGLKVLTRLRQGL